MKFVEWLVAKLSNLKSGPHDYFCVGVLLGGFLAAIAGSGVAILIALGYGLYLFYVEERTEHKGSSDDR